MVVHGEGGEGDVLSSTASVSSLLLLTTNVLVLALGVNLLRVYEDPVASAYFGFCFCFCSLCSPVVILFTFCKICRFWSARQTRHKWEFFRRQRRRRLSIICGFATLIGSGRWGVDIGRLGLAPVVVASSGSWGATFRFGLGSESFLLLLGTCCMCSFRSITD